MIYNFEKLEIWKLSVDFTCEIYRSTKEFPPDERFLVTNQMRRAATSVAANIAEGSARLSNKDRANFIQIAYSSLMEVLNFLLISERLGYINFESLTSFRDKLDKLANKINAYHKQIQR